MVALQSFKKMAARIRQIAPGIAFLLACPLFGRPHIDVIVLQNGDRITGEIKGLNAGILTVDLDYADGNLSIQWLKVARVESSQLFLIQTQDGSVYRGTIATIVASAGQAVKIDILEGPEEKTIDQFKVVKLEETGESRLQQLSVSVQLGSTYSKANNTNQYNLGGDIEYQRERWGGQFNINSNLTSSSGADTATRNQLDLGAYRLMRTSNYYYAGFGGFLQSSVQGIHLQTSLGAGVGRFLKNTNRVKWTAMVGAVWQSTDYVNAAVPVGRQMVYAGIATTDLKLFLFKKTNLDLSAKVVPAFSDPGRVFYTTNATYYLKFFGDFSWNFSFYGNWDTRPPPHFTGGDYGYTSGLKWTFNK
jgi:Protein of unknown function, DUF481